MVHMFSRNPHVGRTAGGEDLYIGVADLTLYFDAALVFGTSWPIRSKHIPQQEWAAQCPRGHVLMYPQHQCQASEGPFDCQPDLAPSERNEPPICYHCCNAAHTPGYRDGTAPSRSHRAGGNVARCVVCSQVRCRAVRVELRNACLVCFGITVQRSLVLLREASSGVRNTNFEQDPGERWLRMRVQGCA